MEYKRIEEFTTVVTGGTPSTAKSEYWDGGVIPWLQSGCCQNCDVDKTEKYITQEGYDNSSTRMMPLNTVMIALTGATAGKVGYLKFEACGNQSITGILPCDSINQRYLFYYLLSQREKILTDCVGGAQAHISQGYVKNIKVPVLSLSEQEKIVEVLTKLSDVISKRQGEINALDNLIKARFVEMFGNPVSNPFKWKKKTLKEVCVKLNDGTHFSPESFESGDYKYITAKNIKLSGFDFTNITYVPEKVHRPIYDRCNPEVGDVLYIKDGATTGIAMVNTLEEEFTLLSSVALLKQDRAVMNGYFLTALLNNEEMYLDIRNNMGGAAITRLTIAKLNAIKVVVPPIELQNQFADFVNQVDKSKVAVQINKDTTQELLIIYIINIYCYKYTAPDLKNIKITIAKYTHIWYESIITSNVRVQNMEVYMSRKVI